MRHSYLLLFVGFWKFFLEINEDWNDFVEGKGLIYKDDKITLGLNSNRLIKNFPILLWRSDS